MIVVESLIELTLFGVNKAQVIVRPGIIGLEPDHLPIGTDGRLVPFLSSKETGQAVPRRHKIRVQLDGLPVRFNCI
jgi:hypothetical protein